MPYQTAVFAEFYADARNEAKERAVEGCEYLNDGYLFTVAPENELKNAYADIEEQIKFVEDNSIELAPVNAFYTLLLCGFLEYMTSYYLEVTKGMRWWDYTGYILNLNGRICAEGLIVFVVGGMAAVYVIVPLIDTALSRVKTKTLSIIGMVLVVTFAADMVYSHYVPNTGEGITDYDAYKKTGAYYTESDA